MNEFIEFLFSFYGAVTMVILLALLSLWEYLDSNKTEANRRFPSASSNSENSNYDPFNNIISNRNR